MSQPGGGCGRQAPRSGDQPGQRNDGENDLGHIIRRATPARNPLYRTIGAQRRLALPGEPVELPATSRHALDEAGCEVIEQRQRPGSA